MDTSDDDEFFFESSHLAFRSNSDYLKLIKHLTILCKARITAKNDIELLEAVHRKALDNPSFFVQQLKLGPLDLPIPIVITKVSIWRRSLRTFSLKNKFYFKQIPSIDFAKYDVNPSNNQSVMDETVLNLKSDKPHTINFWTLDEQRKLEELLHEFPPEAVESQRFAKIAKAMGNRTAKQIASRVQKFFKKLNDANLPVPGSCSTQPLRSRYKTQKQKFKFEKPSTFFPERNIPSDLIMTNDSNDELELEPLETQNDETNRRILYLLKQVREVKKEQLVHFSQDSGHKCFECGENLLLGSFWRCEDCSDEIKYCADCMTCQLLNSNFKHLKHSIQFC